MGMTNCGFTVKCVKGRVLKVLDSSYSANHFKW